MQQVKSITQLPIPRITTHTHTHTKTSLRNEVIMKQEKKNENINLLQTLIGTHNVYIMNSERNAKARKKKFRTHFSRGFDQNLIIRIAYINCVRLSLENERKAKTISPIYYINSTPTHKHNNTKIVFA